MRCVTKTVRDISMKLGTLIKHNQPMCHAQDISMKLDTLIKHDETMCHAQEPTLLFSYLWSYFPLIIFHTMSCLLYNPKAVKDISMKLGTLIKHNEIMCCA